jgi:hypothetical protein
MEDYLKIAFEQIHQGMTMLRLKVESIDDPELMALMGKADVALFKELRHLRLKLGVPYYDDDDPDDEIGGA